MPCASLLGFLRGAESRNILHGVRDMTRNQTHWAYKILSSQSLGTYLRACDIFLLPHDSMCG